MELRSVTVACMVAPPLSVGYDSAAGYFGPPTAPVLYGDLVVTPQVGLLFLLSTPSTSVNFTGSASYVWYTGVINDGTKDISHIEASVGFNAAFNKIGAIEVDIGDNFARSDHSTNTTAGIGLLSLYNSASLAIPIHPGGGAIEISPKVRWDVEFFSQLLPGVLTGCAMDISCNPNLVNEMNYSDISFGVGAKWKFLPKTAAVLDASFDYRTYFNDQSTVAPATGMADTSTNLEGLILRVQGGLTGLITPHISTTLLIGGAGDFGASSAKTVIGQAEVAYLGSSFTIRGGYLRALNPIPIFGTSADNRVYLEGRTLIYGRLSASLLGSFDYVTYSLSQRGDLLFSLQPSLGYQVTSFFSIGASCILSERASNSSFQGINYFRYQPMLTLTLSY